MDVLQSAFETARTRRARVVFPEWEATAEAREVVLRDGLCVPVPLVEPSPRQVDAVVRARGLKPQQAERMLSRPLIRAAAMVGAGEADAMVAGLVTPTRRVIEAAMFGIGLAPGVTQPSSFFLMRIPDGRDLIFADCAVTVAPDASGLAAIARASAASAEALLGQARVALLSYSTGSSGVGPSVEKVAEAARICGFPGPLQADAALDAAVAARKGAQGGDANTLIFPDLDAGNIAYKLCQRLGRVEAIGPFLQGFAKPVCDLSRGATTKEIVAATAITLALG